jgi:hypothetical protein
MFQDYHLYLAPRFLRSQLQRESRPTMLHFTHIPWPGSEYWRFLPPSMRFGILDGLCAADVLGFQTREDAQNFMRTCETLLPGSHVNFRRGRIWRGNHSTYVRDFPISIDVNALRWPHPPNARTHWQASCRSEVIRRGSRKQEYHPGLQTPGESPRASETGSVLYDLDTFTVRRHRIPDLGTMMYSRRVKRVSARATGAGAAVGDNYARRAAMQI